MKICLKVKIFKFVLNDNELKLQFENIINYFKKTHALILDNNSVTIVSKTTQEILYEFASIDDQEINGKFINIWLK